MQAKFDRLTVPLFSELDMKAMIEKMMGFQSIGHNDEAVAILAEYSEEVRYMFGLWSGDDAQKRQDIN